MDKFFECFCGLFNDFLDCDMVIVYVMVYGVSNILMGMNVDGLCELMVLVYLFGNDFEFD